MKNKKPLLEFTNNSILIKAKINQFNFYNTQNYNFKNYLS